MKKQREKQWLIIVLFVSTFAFTCNAQETNKTDTDSIDNNYISFDYYESMPSFPGGNDKLMNYIKKNIKYPLEDKVKGIEGKVIVGFTVTRTGELKEIKILRGLSKQINKEAIRVISLLPKWIPGEHNGEKVDVYYILPVIFRLQQ